MMRREPLEICLFAASGLVSILAIAFPAAAATPVSGEAVYQKRCAACHDSTGPRVPPRDVLEKLSAARILRTLDFGVMMNVASVMTRDEREAVATFLGLAGADAAPSSKNYCADRDVNLTNIPKGAWNGWSPSTENTRYQPRDAVVEQQNGRGADAAPGDGVVVADHRVLDRVVEDQQHHQVERGHLPQLALPGETQRHQQERVDRGRPDDLFQGRGQGQLFRDNLLRSGNAT